MSTAAGQRKIGLIGLGLMGRPMGMNLLKAGHTLTVWNRTPERAKGLVAAGAKLAKTPREVAEASEVLLTIVIRRRWSRCYGGTREGTTARWAD